MSRGVLYLVRGDRAETAVNRSIRSVKEFHPELIVRLGGARRITTSLAVSMACKLDISSSRISFANGCPAGYLE